MHLVGDLSLQGVQWAARRWNGGQAYCDSQLHDVLLGFAVALRWPDVVVNAVNPGWVPTRIGGPGGPDGMELARVTQSWLAGSDDAEARRSGRCRYHQQPADLHPSAHHRALQDHLLDRLRDLSGASSP
ncbi:hypothetical protein BD833_101232 [Blastococcus xanthinilyticus]|uniref:Short subunit dehydrogenase n=2 Tax=Blastococcus xanthinilyticus TaxID=1564164 RepID=A0A5S5D516_9ACTN|nr:hypothetical protein BD833_101232 [Blastococcus xanthinilyticus]